MSIEEKLFLLFGGFVWIQIGNSAIYEQEISATYEGRPLLSSYYGMDAVILGIISCIIGIYFLTFYLKPNFEKIKKLFIKRDKTNFIYIIWIVWIFNPQISEVFGWGRICYIICSILLIISIFIFHSKLKQIT